MFHGHFVAVISERKGPAPSAALESNSVLWRPRHRWAFAAQRGALTVAAGSGGSATVADSRDETAGRHYELRSCAGRDLHRHFRRRGDHGVVWKPARPSGSVLMTPRAEYLHSCVRETI